MRIFIQCKTLWKVSRQCTESRRTFFVRAYILRIISTAFGRICNFCKRWSEQRSILVWLQREYLSTDFNDERPLASRDEDVPFDFDHIYPQSTWYNLRSHRALDKFVQGQGHRRVGNSIGNLRVWDSSQNRSDGDAVPRIKLKLESDLYGDEAKKLWAKSLIDTDQIEEWGRYRGTWDRRSVIAFQMCVELRAVRLYRRFFAEPSFNLWISDS